MDHEYQNEKKDSTTEPYIVNMLLSIVMIII